MSDTWPWYLPLILRHQDGTEVRLKLNAVGLGKALRAAYEDEPEAVVAFVVQALREAGIEYAIAKDAS